MTQLARKEPPKGTQGQSVPGVGSHGEGQGATAAGSNALETWKRLESKSTTLLHSVSEHSTTPHATAVTKTRAHPNSILLVSLNNYECVGMSLLRKHTVLAFVLISSSLAQQQRPVGAPSSKTCSVSALNKLHSSWSSRRQQQAQHPEQRGQQTVRRGVRAAGVNLYTPQSSPTLPHQHIKSPCSLSVD